MHSWSICCGVVLFESRVFDEAFKGFFFVAVPRAQFLDALVALQALLPSERRAEVRRGRQLAPVVERAVRTRRSSCGGSCSWYTTSTRTRWRIGGKRRRSYVRYLGRSYVKEQPSFKATWDETIQVGMWRNVTVMDCNRDENI